MSASLPDFNLYASWGHLPLYACLLVGLPVLVMLAMNLWLAARSASSVRVPEQRLLSEKRDANGIPLFFDQDTHDNDEKESDAPRCPNQPLKTKARGVGRTQSNAAFARRRRHSAVASAWKSPLSRFRLIEIDITLEFRISCGGSVFSTTCGYTDSQPEMLSFRRWNEYERALK
jgi:hypothetical protein